MGSKKDKKDKKEKKKESDVKSEKDKTDKKEKKKSEKDKVKVRVCKKCSGFATKELGDILDKKAYTTGCIGKCIKKKPELEGKVYGYIDGKFTVCDTKDEFFEKIKSII